MLWLVLAKGSGLLMGQLNYQEFDKTFLTIIAHEVIGLRDVVAVVF